MTTRNALALALSAALASTVTVGCATKKYVRETVAPVEKSVAELDKKTADSIAELEKGVSRADERAQSADSRAGAAASEAARANEQASLANKEAAQARALAEKGIARAGEVETALGRKLENVSNYKLVRTQSVLFNLNSAELNDEARQALDSIASQIGTLKNYFIEVQGFTDSTGDAQANIELSRRRAAAVVRYLTLQHKIPLHRVQMMGYGEESPSADNKTRDGRKQNRRVELRVFTLDLGA